MTALIKNDPIVDEIYAALRTHGITKQIPIDEQAKFILHKALTQGKINQIFLDEEDALCIDYDDIE